MGFECGINRVVKLGDCKTVKDFEKIKTYIEWKNNPWNFEDGHYPTFEKYWEAMSGLGKLDGYPNLETVQLYEEYEKENKDIEENIAYWCSIGRNFNGILADALEKVDEYTFTGFNKENIEKIQKWINEELEHSALIPVTVVSAFKENADGTKTLIDINGIIVQNDEGWEKRIYTNMDSEFWDNEYVYIGKNGFDEEKVNALKSLKNALDIVKNTDQDKNLVWFYQSY